MIICEIKKLFSLKKFLIVLMLFVLTACYQIYYSGIFESGTDIDIHKFGLHELKGFMNEEKHEIIKNKREYYSQVRSEWAKKGEILLKGSMSQAEFDSYYDLIKEDIVGYEGYLKVVEDYEYAKQDPAKRYMLPYYPKMFLSGGYQYGLILTLFTLIPGYYYMEKKSEMLELIRVYSVDSAFYGRTKLYISCGIAGVFSLLYSFLELLIWIYMTGSESLTYPVQSLKLFYSAGTSLSIGKIVLIVTGLRLIGAIYMTCLLVVIALISNHENTAIFITSFALIMTELLFRRIDTIYRIPFPFGLLKGTGYLLGDFDEFAYPLIGGIFNRVESVYLMAAIGGAALSFIAALLVTNRYYINYRKKGAKIISLLLLIILTGCSKNSDMVLKDLSNPLMQQNRDRIVYLNGTELMSRDKVTGSSKVVENYPLYSIENTSVSSFYLEEDYLYYGLTTDYGFELVRKNMIDEVRSVLIELNTQSNSRFMGLIQEDYHMKADFYSTFILHKNRIYKCSDGRLISEDLFGNRKNLELSYPNYMGIGAYDGKNIYYIENGYRLASYNIDTKENKLISRESIRNFSVGPEGFVCCGASGIYLIDEKGQLIEDISDVQAKWVGCNEKNVYYTDENDILYRVNKVTGVQKVSDEDQVYMFLVSYNSPDICVFGKKSGGAELSVWFIRE